MPTAEDIDPFGPDAPPLPTVHLLPDPLHEPMKCCNRMVKPGDACSPHLPNVTCMGA